MSEYKQSYAKEEPLSDHTDTGGSFHHEEADDYGQTYRGLKSRHVQLIAIAGCIGTGLFVGSGSSLAQSGPASMFLAYIFLSLVLWAVVSVLGEMTTYLPVSGVSPMLFMTRFVDPSLGWAAGWMYWYAWSFVAPSEITAAASLIQFWTTSVPQAVWIAIILVLIVALNVVMVSFFGESEFWFASIKVIAIVGLIILGVVLFFGGGPNHDRLGFRYWKHGQAFQELFVSGTTGKFLGFWYACVRAGFSFLQSPELLTMSAGECIAPRRNIPKATDRFLYRIAFFYIFSTLVIGVIVSSYRPDDRSRLLSEKGSGILSSPFVIGIQNAGIKVLPHIVNACILTSAISTGNAVLFSGSRMLYSLSVCREAPKNFSLTNQYGVPYVAVLTTAAVSCLAFLNVDHSALQVFTWLTNLSTIAGFIGWICILFAYTRFRKALEVQGLLHTRPYITFFQPYSSWAAMAFLTILTLTNGFPVFINGHWSAADFVSAYITLPIFASLYLGHKAWTKNWQFCLPLAKVDLITGLDEVEAVMADYEEPVPKNLAQKIWFWIA